jgi:hypothetical protein
MFYYVFKKKQLPNLRPVYPHIKGHKMKQSEKLFVFKITEEKEGVRVDFDTVDHEGNVAEEKISIVDLSMIVITLARLLKEQGLTETELEEFMLNIVKETNQTTLIGEPEEPGEPDGQEGQEKDQEDQSEG